MRGKYSPTVEAAYLTDQDWHTKYADSNPEGSFYDPEGYDGYGYNEAGYDRADYQEHEYYGDDFEDDPVFAEHEGVGSNFAYDDALIEWGFDGTKPVKNEH